MTKQNIREEESDGVVLHQLFFNYSCRSRKKLLVSFIDGGTLH